MPNFWVGLLLMLAFCVQINVFPVISSAGDLRSIFLPALTLALAMSSKYTRQVRTAVLEEMNQDYVVGARARGVRESVILWRNVFPMRCCRLSPCLDCPLAVCLVVPVW